MYFLNHILKILGINEKIIDIKPTEYITMDKKGKIKIFDNLLDFVAVTKSGIIIIFEFKKDTLRKKDFKQTYDYYRRVYCKEKKDVKTIIITISKGGKLTSYTHFDVTYKPKIIKTKRINQQQNLKVIRNKFKNNRKLTSLQCSLLIALPLFELKESEGEIVREMCEMIKTKKKCIPSDELDGVIMGMHLNILEYIDENDQEELKEMIDLQATEQGIIQGLIDRGKKLGFDDGMNKGMDNGKREIISNLLANHPLSEVARRLEMGEDEIIRIIQK
jgi:hypothetical protein